MIDLGVPLGMLGGRRNVVAFRGSGRLATVSSYGTLISSAMIFIPLCNCTLCLSLCAGKCLCLSNVFVLVFNVLAEMDIRFLFFSFFHLGAWTSFRLTLFKLDSS